MSDTPTPRTDEVFSHEGNWDTKALRMNHHAKQLERELADAKDQCESLQRLLENVLREDADGQDYKDARKYLERMKGGSDE